MRSTTILFALVVLAGCDDEGGRRTDDQHDGGNEDEGIGLLPSAPLDQDGTKSISMLVGPDVELPGCFSEVVEIASPDGPEEYDTFWMVEFRSGRDVLEEGRDDGGAFWGQNVFDYDSDGNLTHAAYDDVRAPSEPDWQMWMTYDESGNRLTYSADDDADPEEEWRATYEYGPDGELIAAELESMGPATPWRRTYDHDEHGRVNRMEQDDGSDGTIERETRFEYDEAERVIHSTTTGASGAVIRTGRIEYDEQGRLVLDTATDGPFDWGTYTFSAAHIYDSSDRLDEDVYENEWLDADGGLDNRNQTTRYYVFGDLCII